jgi:hypothetical protein
LCRHDNRHGKGTDKLTIFAPKSGYLVRRTAQYGTRVGAAIDEWGDTRRIG